RFKTVLVHRQREALLRGQAVMVVAFRADVQIALHVARKGDFAALRALAPESVWHARRRDAVARLPTEPSATSHRLLPSPFSTSRIHPYKHTRYRHENHRLCPTKIRARRHAVTRFDRPQQQTQWP